MQYYYFYKILGWQMLWEKLTQDMWCNQSHKFLRLINMVVIIVNLISD